MMQGYVCQPKWSDKGARRLEAGAYMCKSILRLGIRRNRHSCSRCNHLKSEQFSKPVSGPRVFRFKVGTGLPMFEKFEKSYGAGK